VADVVALFFQNRIKIPYLNRNEKASHECSVLFFTPGRFKADIQCRSLNSTTTTTHLNDFNAHTTSTIQHGLIALNNNNNNNETHIWRFIPPVEITVVEF
jgi:trafficking protein particle complex subunit 9